MGLSAEQQQLLGRVWRRIGQPHLGWVDKGHGDHQGQMAVLVKPRGRFGTVYMDLIKPFRYWIVYPALMRQVERAWDNRST